MGMRRLFLCVLCLAAGCSPKCYVKKTEQVDFFPTYAYQQTNGPWKMPVTAWVHDAEPSPKIQSGLSRVVSLMQLMPGAGAQATDLKERITPFLLHGQPKKAIPVQLSETTFKLEPTDSDGFARQELTVPASVSLSTGTRIEFKTQSCRDDSRQFTGQALVIPATGTSVISDLDGLLASAPDAEEEHSGMAIAQPYEPDAALAVAYQKWQAQGAVFHYVSAKPWQLYGPLSRGLERQGFPSGVLHLKSLPMNSMGSSVEAMVATLSTLFGPATTTKQPAIEALLRDFPGRHFILIGDARQKDEIVFAGLARKYPQQISRILIRSPQTNSDQAITRVMEGLPTSTWIIFRNPNELATLQR